MKSRFTHSLYVMDYVSILPYLFSFIFQLSYALVQYDFFVCPLNYDEVAERLSMECERAPVFKLEEYSLPIWVQNICVLVRFW